MAREYLRFVTESSYGTPKTTPVVNTDAFYGRLYDSDTFSGQMVPMFVDIPYGGGLVTPADQVSDQYTTAFSFKTYLYPGNHSATLLKWAMTPVNTGRTLPWTTTDAAKLMPEGDLASLSFYHAIQQDDSTYDRRRYGGAKCFSWNISVSDRSRAAILTCTGQAIRDDLNGVGAAVKPDATEFPFPTDSQYPMGPYTFSHTGGAFQLIDSGSTFRTMYHSLTLSGTNTIDVNTYESKYPIIMRFCGRNTRLQSQLRMRVTPADLQFFQAITKLKTNIKFDNGVNSLSFDFKSTNYMRGLTRSLPIGQEYRYSADVLNLWDPTAGTDVTVTAT